MSTRARHRRDTRHPLVRHLVAVVHRKPTAPETETALPPQEQQGDAKHQPNLSEVTDQFLRREQAFLAQIDELTAELATAQREVEQLREERTAGRARHANRNAATVPAPADVPGSAWFRGGETAETPRVVPLGQSPLAQTPDETRAETTLRLTPWRPAATPAA